MRIFCTFGSCVQITKVSQTCLKRDVQVGRPVVDTKRNPPQTGSGECGWLPFSLRASLFLGLEDFYIHQVYIRLQVFCSIDDLKSTATTQFGYDWVKYLPNLLCINSMYIHIKYYFLYVNNTIYKKFRTMKDG